MQVAISFGLGMVKRKILCIFDYIKTKTMKLQDLKENDLIQVRREQYNELGNINL